jgi:glycosyltransferase involved in cell wall biosynthesis
VRILIASSHRNLVGGVEKYLQAMLPALAERQHQVGLVHECKCDWNRERIDPANWESPVWCVEETGAEQALRSIASWAPDVVYLQGLESVALESALVDRYPTVFYAHNYYGTCVSGRKCYSSPQIQPCTRTMSAACLALYYPRRCGGLHPATALRMFRTQLARKSQLVKFRAILVASQHMRKEFKRNGVLEDQVQLLPLPSNDSVPDPAPFALKIPEGRILFLGRLTDIKGAEFLIRALPLAGEKLGRRLSLTIAGDGPELENLRKLAPRLNASVEFVGWIDRERKFGLLRQTDLLALPSLWPEPFGLVGVEAGSLGVPTVAYEVGGIPEWLIAGVSGELAPGNPPTVEGLADAIVRALASVEHYNQLRYGALEIASRFNLEDHLAKLEPVLFSALPPAGQADDSSTTSEPHLIPIP